MLQPDIPEKKASLDRSELTDTLPQGEGLGSPTGCVTTAELKQ